MQGHKKCQNISIAMDQRSQIGRYELFGIGIHESELISTDKEGKINKKCWIKFYLSLDDKWFL